MFKFFSPSMEFFKNNQQNETDRILYCFGISHMIALDLN